MQELDISFGKNRSDTNWKPEYLTWDDFVEKLQKVRRTGESMAEYDRMSNAEKGKIKDGKAFVGGLVKGGRRKKENVESRWLLTLDADSSDEDFLFNVELAFGSSAYAVYSTHSSRPDSRKYRVVAPVDHAMSPDEHAAVSRRMAAEIGLDYFDRTTFDVHRLMYLPSCSRDAEPEFYYADGSPLKVDEVLSGYADWRDPMEWPRYPDDIKHLEALRNKLGDPTEKPGVIGSFCQVYSITEGLEKFLVDVYEPTLHEDRYTFTSGSSVGGMRIYDDWWAYSEHQSDPANDGHCHNIFDLVRIHKFGDLDDDIKPNTPGTKRPSHQAMLDFAANDPTVKKERLLQDFGELEDEETNLDWMDQLDVHSKTGKPLSTAKNAELILRNGSFDGVLAYDAFGNSEVVRKALPWRDRERPQREYEPWLGADDKRLQHYFGKVYDFKSAATIQNAFTEVVHTNTFHPIKEYLEAQRWDGIKRVDRLFVTYLGAPDNHYTHSVTRKMLLAAVKRLYEPGCKFDNMMVLVGPQGAGKSSLLAKIGRKWFSDSLRTFENKEAGEHLQGAWIFEIGELSAMKKAEVEEIKAFLSKTDDRYRVAYDRQVSEFPRKCVFFGTTNNHNFLQDPTGNRRFWPINCNPSLKEESHWEHLTEELVGLIWAEVLHLYRGGERLELDKSAADEAERIQGLHLEEDPREGLIMKYLETPLPEDWESRTTWQRREYLDDPNGEIARTRVCAAEVWAEALGLDPAKFTAWEARAIYDILRKLPDWQERDKGRINFRLYGKQTAFEKRGQ
ncbi:virulence protein E [Paenibacillus odorifer]|uniref:virulence-associated E family protein n=1 Tax=Paenibacillus odorifer TaxID=189426 RepID=UPI00096DDFDA|nr:virulence-associated E family protein [Paenibacillus odorifer]OMD93001.1 virulence protein E [Paenibacillus odorifer]